MEVGAEDKETPEAAKGRPTAYTPELGEALCELLAEGMTLKAICRAGRIFRSPKAL